MEEGDGQETSVEIAGRLGHAVKDADAADFFVIRPVTRLAFERAVGLAVASAAALDWLSKTGVGFLADATNVHGTLHGLTRRKADLRW